MSVNNDSDITHKNLETNPQVQLMLDACPMACIMFDEHFEAIDCNYSAMEIGSARTKAELLETYRDYYPSTQPDGEDSIIKMQRHLEDAAKMGRLRTDWMYQLLDGSEVPCKITISKMEWNDTFRLIMYAEDLRELTEEIHKMKEAENRSQLMMDNTLLITSLWNSAGEMVDCSMYALKVFGLENKDDYMEHFYDLNPEYQPNGMTTAEAAEYHIGKAFSEGYDKFDWLYLTIKGEDLPVETTLIRVWWNNEFHLLAHSIDKREIESTNAKLKNHAQLLQANNEIANSMMAATTTRFEELICKQLERLGRVARVNRTYIWKNFEKDGKVYCEQLYEWSENAETQYEKAYLLFDYDDVPYAKEKILVGEAINGPISIFSDKEYEVYKKQGVCSILLMPLMLNSKVWGFIGFDDCENEDVFSSEVAQLLRSCGALLVSAISRNTTTLNLISTKNALLLQDKLLRAVNESAKILLESHDKKHNNSILKVLQIIGDSVDAHSVGIWENFDEENGELYSKRIAIWSVNEEKKFQDEPIISYREYLKQWDDGATHREIIHISMSNMNRDFLNWLVTPEEPEFLILPINLDGEFWGFASFSFTDENHVLSDNEKSILQSANLMIASAIIRDEVSRKLVSATRAAIESVRAKNEFLARMSHEIRTPINAVMGMSTIAKGTTDLGKIYDCLDTVTTSSRQLLAIIDDVLDMSKIDLGKLTILNEAFDFEKMLSSILEMLREKIEEKNLRFRYDFECLFKRFFISDEKRLMQVIVNLMTNAIKFTPEGGEITLRVRVKKRATKENVQISIIDNGIGIPESAQSIIFNPFEQGDGSITREYGGTGLGLAISKNIINLMGGDLFVESEQGQGSTFTFEVPTRWNDNGDIQERMSRLPKEMKILVLEKNLEDLQYFRKVLQTVSLDCDGAIREQEALTKAYELQSANSYYDIAFIAFDIGENSGIAIAKKIQQLSSNTKVVMITGISKLGTIEKVKGREDWGCIINPVMPISVYQILTSDTVKEREHARTDQKHFDWSNQTILLVEDMEINREIVKALLEDTKVKIDGAENGQEALDMFCANQGKYDLIFMDMQMPIMDGLTATRSIRKMSSLEAKTVPIYAMTANVFKEDVEHCLEAGMNGYLSKPIDVAKLYEVLEKEFEK